MVRVSEIHLLEVVLSNLILTADQPNVNATV